MIHKMLRDKIVILASASPRRKELFSLLGINARIVPADVAEPLSDEAPELQAMHHAQNKAMHIYSLRLAEELIVAADTLVAVGKHVLGKPNNVDEAKAYLRLLSGRKHKVYTGICLGYKGEFHSTFESTQVSFAKLSEAEIEAYISTGEPMDKAGAYGIQGYGAQFITRVDGCYFNVMGFPIRKFYDTLQKMLKVQL